MTDLTVTTPPYTEADVLDEAVLLGHALSRTPSLADLVRSLRAQYIPSRRAADGTGPTYGELLDADGITALAHAVHDRITDAADVSYWGVRLGQAGLTPQEPMGWYCVGSGWDVAVQVATSPDLTDQAREELLQEIRTAVDATVKRVLCLKDV